MGNGDGKWQLAFWLVTVICGVWLLCLTGGVIEVDKARASEDIRLSSDIKEWMVQNSRDHTAIKVSLARIATTLGIRNE